MTIANCRVHPERPAEVWIHGAGTEVCRECSARWDRERLPNERNIVLGWIQRQTSVLCPGCAHDYAIVEDAQRELAAFLQEVDNTVRVGFE